MIEVMELTKWYGKKRGVEDITFSVQEGEVVGLLGPNGAGKSTIMKMLTGYHAPTSGVIRIDGLDALKDSREARACIGFMAELPPLYLDMEVSSYLRFVAEIKGVKREQRKAEIERVMKLAGIYEVGKRLIRNLSKGYRQRVGLAQALIGDPKVLILDEPTAGLDPKQISEVRNMILKLKGKHTMIVSSHILSEIRQICDRVIIMKEGKLVAVDTLESLLQKKRNSTHFYITVKGDPQKIQKMTKEVPGVRRMNQTDETVENGYHRFLIESDGQVATREAIFILFAAQGWPLIEMRSSALSLEHIFLELTQEEAQEESA